MDVTQTLKDSAYVAVGFSVLGFQRAQVARRELTSELEGRLDDVEQRLPDHVKAVVASARQAAEIAATQVRSLLAA